MLCRDKQGYSSRHSKLQSGEGIVIDKRLFNGGLVRAVLFKDKGKLLVDLAKAQRKGKAYGSSNNPLREGRKGIVTESDKAPSCRVEAGIDTKNA
jgi:hypothetical protein